MAPWTQMETVVIEVGRNSWMLYVHVLGTLNMLCILPLYHFPSSTVNDYFDYQD